VRASLLSLVLALLAAAAAAGGGEDPSAEQVLARAEERFEALTDYECLIESESRLGQRVERGAYRFSYRHPGMLRVRVLRGRFRGSEVTRDRQGRYRGRRGGLLKLIVVDLDPDDGRLRSVRGVPLAELDWGSFYRKLRERAGRPGARLSLAPARDAAGPYELVLTCGDAAKRRREVYRIDREQWVLVEGDVLEDDARVDHVTFRAIRFNPGRPERWFRL